MRQIGMFGCYTNIPRNNTTQNDTLSYNARSEHTSAMLVQTFTGT